MEFETTGTTFVLGDVLAMYQGERNVSVSPGVSLVEEMLALAGYELVTAEQYLEAQLNDDIEIPSFVAVHDILFTGDDEITLIEEGETVGCCADNDHMALAEAIDATFAIGKVTDDAGVVFDTLSDVIIGLR